MNARMTCNNQRIQQGNESTKNCTSYGQEALLPVRTLSHGRVSAHVTLEWCVKVTVECNRDVSCTNLE